MKLFIFIISMLTMINNASAAEFSAFSKGDNLYVTILTDGCNAYGVSFETDGICRSDRMTDNYATECSGSLRVISTARMCANVEEIPMAFELSLSESLVAPEAEALNITYGNEVVSVKLQQQ